MAKKQSMKPAGKGGPSRAKLNKFVLMMEYDVDYRGLDFTSVGIIESTLKDLKIPRSKWAEFLGAVQEKKIFDDVEIQSSGMRVQFNVQKFVEDKYDDADLVYIDDNLHDLVEYRGPRGAFNDLEEKGRYLSWLENVREWAFDEYGHFVAIPVEKFIGSIQQVENIAMDSKENEKFAKMAYRDGYLLKAGSVEDKYKLPFVVADEEIWMRLHKSTAFPRAG
jgi:hypothetical protein